MRLALAQINPIVGDIEGNRTLIVGAILRAREARADLVVFPELALCGYPPKDLLLAEGFLEACLAAAKEIGEGHTTGLTAIFGLPLPHDRRTYAPGHAIHNSLLVYRDNVLVDHYDKRLLPTYDVFDEDRYFVPGSRGVVIDVPVGGEGHSTRHVRVGLTICEDLWKGEDAGFLHRYVDALDPVVELVRAGAEMIVSPSASPFVLGKREKHRAILAGHAKKHHLPVVSLNQLGANDDLLFDGHALVYAPGGELFNAGPCFREHLHVVDVPVGRVAGEWTPRPSPTLDAADPAMLHAAPEHLLFEALVLGIRDYLRKTGFKSALIGLSGGIDSALTAALAVAAIGPANVLGVALPGEYSSDHSKADAYDLARRLGMECPTVPIEPPLAAFRRIIDPMFRERKFSTLGERLPDLTEENIQSRIRGTTLMTISNRTGAIVLTTGNKSELAVGYCTLYGDMNGGLAVLSDVSKMMVYALSRWINANAALCGFAESPIPQRTIDKAPSAELRPDQTDQDSLPPYEVLDDIIERHVERRQSAGTIIRETGYDAKVVRRCTRLISLAEYKRKQAATGLKVTTVAFGSGRRVPIAQRWPG